MQDFVTASLSLFSDTNMSELAHSQGDSAKNKTGKQTIGHSTGKEESVLRNLVEELKGSAGTLNQLSQMEEPKET